MDRDYQRAGATIAPGRSERIPRRQLIVKVKEPAAG